MKRSHLFLLLIFCMSTLTLAQAQQTQLPPLVSTTGTGEVKVQPDEVVISLGVQTRAKTLDAARQENDKQVAAILQYLKKQGIENKDVQTTYINVHPIYPNRDYGQSTPESYQAQKTMTIKFRKMDKFDELMSGLYKNGVNQVNGISFQTSELEKHRTQARKLAVQAAKQKAQLLTTELGAKIGRVYNITESGSQGGPRPMYKANMMMESAAYDAGGPTISGGEITISETIEVSFVIE